MEFFGINEGNIGNHLPSDSFSLVIFHIDDNRLLYYLRAETE